MRFYFVVILFQFLHGCQFNQVPDVVSVLSINKMHGWKKILLQRALEMDMKRADQWNHSASSDWPGHYPECSGMKQSPININTGMISSRSEVDDIQLVDYDKLVGARFVLNKHHLRLRTTSADSGIGIRGYDLISNFQWIDWHFGSQNAQGSEHSINGRHFPMELQFFHKNKPEIGENGSNFTAISCMFELASEDNSVIEQLLHELKDYMNNKGKSSKTFKFSLNKLLPESSKANIDEYYSYSGSVTWPPCTENVQWILLQNYGSISQSQLVKIRKIFKNRSINFARPAQMLHGRIVMNSLLHSDVSSKIVRRKPKSWQFKSAMNSAIATSSDYANIMAFVFLAYLSL